MTLMLVINQKMIDDDGSKDEARRGEDGGKEEVYHSDVAVCFTATSSIIDQISILIIKARADFEHPCCSGCGD
jgi:hypothetical protein